MNLEQKKKLLLQNILDFFHKSNFVRFFNSGGVAFVVKDANGFKALLCEEVISLCTTFFCEGSFRLMLYDKNTLELFEDICFADKKFALGKISALIFQLEEMQKKNLMAYQFAINSVLKISSQEEYNSFISSKWESGFVLGVSLFL